MGTGPLNLKTSERLDSIDEERFREMTESPSFALFRTRISAELERSRTDCEGAYGIELQRAQGKVKALRTVLALPGLMLSEMKAKR